MKKLLMGNQAVALGAIRAGVQVVTGYPGTPSTEILQTIADSNKGDIYVEWSINEKVALEVAAGAAYAGARTLVTMKQVGLNVASDPLMSLNYVGVKGGLVIVVADDPGPISSQTEQDTRHFGIFSKVAVFDVATPQEAYTMVADAFDYSEKYNQPVFLRLTTRVCHSRAQIELLPELAKKPVEGFVKDSKWVIFPRLAYENHIKIEEKLNEMAVDFADYRYNILTGSGKVGFATGGVSYSYLREALAGCESEYKLLKLATVPFPEALILEFLQGLERVLVLEELDPVIETGLLKICGRHNIKVEICGKLTGHVANAGENSAQSIAKAAAGFVELPQKEPAAQPIEQLPPRPPVLCAGCPHRASFLAVKWAAQGKKAVFSGDIGCYTLGNAKPIDMVDTCLCMGAGLTVAQGLERAEPGVVHFGFIGDSTFFHSGITGIANAVYNQTDVIVVVLDNSTTAMTGGQPHPGTGQTMMRSVSEKISIYNVVKALNVDWVERVNPFDLDAAQKTVEQAMAKKGVRVILFEAPCIMINKTGDCLKVNNQACTGCRVCLNKTGCPALSYENKKAVIEPSLCNGCGVCAYTCKFGAITK